MAKRVEPLREYFTDDYMKRKARDFEQSSQAAEIGVDSMFEVQGSKIKTYQAYSVHTYFLPDYSEHPIELARILQDSGEHGLQAYNDKTPLIGVDRHKLLAASIPSNKEAEQFFSDKPEIVVMRETTDERKHNGRPYHFVHWPRESRVAEGASIVLPLEYWITREWSNDSSFEIEKQQELPKIEGNLPYFMGELVQASAQNVLHPHKEYPGPQGQSARYMPLSCYRYNCPICFSFQRLNEPFDYSDYLWTLGPEYL